MANDWSTTPAGPNQPGCNFSEITDGLSNTVFIGEKHVPANQINTVAGQDGPAYNGDKGYSFRVMGANRLLARPLNEPAGGRFGSWHTGVVNFALGDGSVRAIRNTLDGTTLGLLANRRDERVIPNFD